MCSCRTHIFLRIQQRCTSHISTLPHACAMRYTGRSDTDERTPTTVASHTRNYHRTQSCVCACEPVCNRNRLYRSDARSPFGRRTRTPHRRRLYHSIFNRTFTRPSCCCRRRVCVRFRCRCVCVCLLECGCKYTIIISFSSVSVRSGSSFK